MMPFRIDDDFLTDMFDAQSEYIIWSLPVFNDRGEIVDFEVAYGNKAAATYTRTTKETIIGVRLFGNPSLDNKTSELVFQQTLQVHQTGEPLNTTYHNPVLDTTLLVTRSKFRHGVLSTTREYTREAKLYQEKEKQQLFTQMVLNASINGLLFTESVRNDSGQVTDFIVRSINPAFTRIMNMTESDVVGKRYLSLFPFAKHNGLFDANVQVVESGVSSRKEFYYKLGHQDAWFDISINRLQDGFLATFTDITQSVQRKNALKEFADYLQNIINTSQTGITVLSPCLTADGTIEDFEFKLCNKAFSRYTNKLPEEVIGHKLGEFFSSYRQTVIYEQYCTTALTGTQIRNEVHYNHDGLDVWLDVRSTRMDEDLLVTLQDFTEIQSLQEDFRLSAKRLNAVFNASQSGMFTFIPVLDHAGEIVDFTFVIVNKTLSAYVGQEPESLEGDLGSRWFPGYLTNGVFDMYKQTFLTGETGRKNVHYNVDGINVYLDLASTRVGDELLVTFTDYTELKTLQIEMEQKVEQLERSNQKLADFAHAASHDLKEPIRKIQFYADMLRKDLEQAQQTGKKNLLKLEQATSRMRELVDDLLEYSHVSMAPVVSEEVDLGQKVQMAFEDLEIVVKEKEATFSVAPLPTVYGSQRQLQQLFQNLLSNALKYSKPGVPPHVVIQYKLVEGNTLDKILAGHDSRIKYHNISISDNGIGFDQQYAAQIFQVFQRLHGNSHYKGTGVGLSIVQKVVENHNGFIRALGKPGEGAIFNVYLPITTISNFTI